MYPLSLKSITYRVYCVAYSSNIPYPVAYTYIDTYIHIYIHTYTLLTHVCMYIHTYIPGYLAEMFYTVHPMLIILFRDDIFLIIFRAKI